MKLKAFFIIFKGLSVAKNCLRPASAPLKQPGFSYSSCGSFTKHRKRIQEFRETGDLKHLYRYELEKGYFAHDAAYSDSKGLAKRTI